ncbi:MAG: glycosyl hydrolase-related protein [Planctomycetes bacterium]|nr:glycosyl hydrolase-related protein [Planctomycetota bacterium]
MPFHLPAEERLYIRRAELVAERLREAYITDSVVLDAQVAVLPPHTRPTFADKPASGYRPVREGEEWGREWQTGWFRLSGTVPAAWAGRQVVGWIDTEGEGLVYDLAGTAIQGVTHGSVFDKAATRPFVPLFAACAGGERVELWLEAAASMLFGVAPYGDPTMQDRTCICHVGRLRLAAVDPAAWSLRHDFEVLLDLLKALPADSVRRARLLRAVTKASEVLAKDERAYAAAAAELAGVKAKRANASDIPVRAVGHAHIDTAWLWPLGETIRKTARTYASQLKLIEDYPGYVFGASAAQHYAWMKDRHPEMYARIKAAVKAGSWEIQGGMWVEADCNVTGGESLVRQFLHGKNFFRDEFAWDVDNLWIPDVFGYAASLPQIMAQAGVTTFLTQKISWNQFNEFPFHTFWWQGIDGTRVLTHFPPENNYNGEVLPAPLIAAEARFKEKDVVDEVMSLFGIGDGGGGPRPDHIERGLRLKDLEGCPPVKFGQAREFFANLRTSQDELRTWVGELYLELHRGTLTSQAYVKKCNRQLEHRLRELEMLWSAALPQYPLAAFDAIWKEMLTLQFHDIIPGSSIRQVYAETNAAHDRLLAACDQLEAGFAAAALPARPGATTLFNSLSEEFAGAVVLDATFAGKGARIAGGAAVPTQAEDGATVALVRIPAQGFITLEPAGAPGASAANDLVLENELVRYTFDQRGQVVSALDKATGAELLSAPGNRVTLYHDRPNFWDAWDIDKFYKEERIADLAFAVERLGAGPVRSRLRLTATAGSSPVTQIVTLAAGSRRLDFATTVEWRERHRMLRVSFPAAVRTERAACEIQYGHLFRATHANTSWDMAKFEVPAHRWVDLSEADRGIALLNDCKYGYSVHGNVLDLNLLRSPTNPDPEADQGRHTFTYSLFAHPGDLVAGGVVREAGLLNQPPVRFAGRSAPAAAIPASIRGGEGVELAVVKRAEKSAQVVIRLAETRGRRSRASVVLPAAARLVPCDLMEWHDGTAGAPAREHALELRPFEIRTYKILA